MGIMVVLRMVMALLLTIWLINANIVQGAKAVESKGVADIKECANKAADIVFLVDESSSVGTQQFHDILAFIISLVCHFPIGSDAVQVGLVKYHKTVTDVFPLNYHKDKQSLLEAISNVTYEPGNATMTDKALEFLRLRGLVPANGARSGVPGVGVLITNGKSWHRKRTIKQAQLAKEGEIIIFAVGIGRQVNEKDLDAIASKPTENNALLVKDADTLRQVGEYIANNCNEINGSNQSHQYPAYNITTPVYNDTIHVYNVTELPNIETRTIWNLGAVFMSLAIVSAVCLILSIFCIAAACIEKSDGKNEERPLLGL